MRTSIHLLSLQRYLLEPFRGWSCSRCSREMCHTFAAKRQARLPSTGRGIASGRIVNARTRYWFHDTNNQAQNVENGATDDESNTVGIAILASILDDESRGERLSRLSSSP
jgi:hypothetical protein